MSQILSRFELDFNRVVHQGAPGPPGSAEKPTPKNGGPNKGSKNGPGTGRHARPTDSRWVFRGAVFGGRFLTPDLGTRNLSEKRSSRAATGTESLPPVVRTYALGVRLCGVSDSSWNLPGWVCLCASSHSLRSRFLAHSGAKWRTWADVLIKL